MGDESSAFACIFNSTGWVCRKRNKNWSKKRRNESRRSTTRVAEKICACTRTGYDEPWKWGKEQQVALEKIKEMLTVPALLVHLNENKPITLSCVASPYGVGTVLSHLMGDNSIAYASCSLSTVERKYSVRQGGACNIVWRKFHHYLYGRHFVIYIANHKCT